MTLYEFFGCTFIAFGPPCALFIFTIASDSLRVVVMMASAFFWLLALLLSSLLWYAVVPLRQELAFGLVFSVLIQELFRYLFYLLLAKAADGLAKVVQAGSSSQQSSALVQNKHVLAYVCGIGYGLISGAFSLINVLADMTGPGTIGIKGESQLFFITSAFLTLAFILLHTFWNVIFFWACDRKKYIAALVVVASHMLVSCLTLLNRSTPPIYMASLIPTYAVLIAMGGWAYAVAGGSISNIKAFIMCKTGGYNMD